MAKATPLDRIASALWGTHGRDDTNITDAMFAIADAINRLASKVDDLRTDHPLMGQTFGGVEAALTGIADAINAIPAPEPDARANPPPA